MIGSPTLWVHKSTSRETAKEEGTMRQGILSSIRLSAAILALELCAPMATRAAAPTDLSLRVSAPAFRVGTSSRYTVTVANRGRQITDDVMHVHATLPAGLSIVSASGLVWTCTVAGQSVDCTTQQPLRSGRTSTIRLGVGVCTAAFPLVNTTFQLDYAGDTNTANNTVTKSTLVRAGVCTAGATPTPAATHTPGTPPPATPTPVPTAGNPAAPVVTSFTCNGAAQCSVSLGQAFTLQFTFTDPNANAISWRMTTRRDDGVSSDIADGTFGTKTGSGTVPLQFPPFTCDQSPCRQATFTFFVVVTDTTGFNSAAATVPVTVRASGQ